LRYRSVVDGEPLSGEQLQAGWSPQRVGRHILFFPEVSSTNAVALDAAEKADADGLAVLADYQSAGRGRLGRGWSSPRGASVLCSVLLIENADAASGSSPAEDNYIAGRLTLASAVAACEAVRQAGDVVPSIKWPNDIRVRGRKLGGILIESRAVAAGRAWVIGIGLNCLQHAGHFPPELRETATSIELESAHAVHRLEVARLLLQRLDAWLAFSPAIEAVHSAWLTYAEPVGQHVRLRCEGREFSGRTEAVDPEGGLILQLDSGGRSWFDPLLTTML